jgi:hypothetical protein
VLFPPAAYRRTTPALISWWESRRLTYNVVVGGAGVVTLVFMQLIAWLPPGVAVPPLDWRPVVVYALLANICYTFGWGLEVVAQRVWKEKCPPFGPALFRQGLAFSVGLTLLPILLVSIGWLVRVAMLILR